MAKKLKEDTVLVISAEGAHREQLGGALKRDSMPTSFVGNLTTVFDIIEEMRPSTLLHDWAAVDPSQAAAFQQKLGKMADWSALCRIIYVETITPQLLALASDCSVRKVISYATSLLNLPAELRMTANASKTMGDVQSLIHRVAAGDTSYSQTEVDDVVEKAHKQFAHDPAVRLEFGNLCFRKGQMPQAHDLATKLLEAQPQNVRAMNLMGRVLMKEGKFAEAAACLEKANGLSPFNTERLLMLGDVFFQTGDTAKAASYYSQAAQTDPGNAAAGQGFGKIQLGEADLNSALDLFKNSASEEEAAGFFNNAAVHAAKQGRLEESLKLYETAMRALRTDKLKHLVNFNIALAYERLGRLEDALKYAKRSVKYDPKFDKAKRTVTRLDELIYQNGKK